MVAHRFCPEQQTNLFSKFSDLPFTEEVVATRYNKDEQKQIIGPSNAGRQGPRGPSKNGGPSASRNEVSLVARPTLYTVF